MFVKVIAQYRETFFVGSPSAPIT